MTLLPFPASEGTTPPGNLVALDIHAVSRPAGFFTGDFYHYGRRDDGALFAIGDVAGKGLDAAIFMAMIQEILERKIAEGSSCCLPDLVEAIDEEIGGELPSNRFASLVLGHVAPDGSLQLVNAGHCPPLIRRSSGEIETICSGGPVVGIHPAPEWVSSYLRMNAGDSLLLYTDGVLEALSPSGDEYGLARIRESLGSLPAPASSREISESVLSDVWRFRENGAAHDDTTIMAIRF